MDLITNSYVVELALTVGKIMLVVGPLPDRGGLSDTG